MENHNQILQMDQSTLSHYYPWKADEPQPTRNQRPAEEGLQWGSDPSFCYHGYSSPIGTWTEERLVQNLMRNMASFCTSMDLGFDIPKIIDEQPQKRILEPRELNGFTMPIFRSSTVPQNERLSETLSSPPSSLPSLSSPSSSSPSSSSPPSSSPSSSSSIQDQTVFSDNFECTQRPSCIKARNKSGQTKRKCVQRAGQKLCHCRSEKKRRQLVGDRYKELCRIVPGLDKQSYTRKYVLEGAALWIERLVEGNDTLHQQLEQLKEQERLNQSHLSPVEEEKVNC
ncbi:uncharacterized protein N7479_004598 [Penicillium vulpinum]|uniref:uncharacterized protein n=1 Tax=Penicillium vulpinum TaxID=29845 RepID=UPI0025481544|nr:uncharacterized protein N7479_004598 [Penicillium vulpinum]KAJ5964722.1 hypothetical protein N7479_004598 [Penicillium vulpinum]